MALAFLVFSTVTLAGPPRALSDCHPAATKINIRADIDGRSWLIVQGNTVQWHHFDWAAPGRESPVDLPTVVNCADWYPVWPDEPNRRNDFCDCYSSILTPDPPLPSLAAYIGIQRVSCRHRCDVVQAPNAANGYALVIEFNDNPEEGSTEYEVNILIGTASTVLTNSTQPGGTTLEVDSTDGFAAGDAIRINPGGPSEEDNTVVGIGSLELASPLLFEHEVGETVVNLTLPLDHFLCYKAKLTKRRLCSAGAPVNAGQACAKEEDCGGITSQTGFCIPNLPPSGVRVSLADQFETAEFDLGKPVSLCNPVDKNGEGISDSETHLLGYQIQLAKTEPAQPKFVKRANLKVVNQFGTLLVDALEQKTLLAPTAKSLQEPVPPPDPQGHEVDHFKCYKAKARSKLCLGDPARRCKTDTDCGEAGPCAGKFPEGLEVTLEDQFTDPRRYVVAEPSELCTPVDKNGEGIKHAGAHLMCYQIKPVKKTCQAGSPQNALGACKKEEDCGGVKEQTAFCQRQPKREKVVGIHTGNQFGQRLLDAVKELELCVPSEKTLAAGN